MSIYIYITNFKIFMEKQPKREGSSYRTKRRNIKDHSKQQMNEVRKWLNSNQQENQYSKDDIQENVNNLDGLVHSQQSQNQATITSNQTDSFGIAEAHPNYSDYAERFECDSSSTCDYPTDCDSNKCSNDDDYYSHSCSTSLSSNSIENVNDKIKSDINPLADETGTDISSLKENLVWWVNKFKVSQVATKCLLQFLKPYIPNLPSDPHSFLHTPRQYDIKQVGNGSYYHFGIANGIISQISNLKYSGRSFSIQINIDGLPISKSSKIQFWPILGLIKELKSNEPFVIGIYCGES